jgi:hypothetical protein
MERTKWTDDLLDQRMASMDEKFELLFTETRCLRKEMSSGFSDLRREIAGVRDEPRGGVRTEIGGVRTEIGGVRTEIGGVRAEIVADRAQAIAFHRQILILVGSAYAAMLGLLGVVIAQL